MNEDIKKEIREIIHTYCGGNYENRRMATELILQKCQEKQLTLTGVVVPKGTLCCPECKSTDLKVAIHTDYKECNKCYHYWEI